MENFSILQRLFFAKLILLTKKKLSYGEIVISWYLRKTSCSVYVINYEIMLYERDLFQKCFA